jgi:hypothetical protein
MYKVEMYLRVRGACFVDGMSIREAARMFGLHRETVRKMLKYSVPSGYRREHPPRQPKLDPYRGVIDQILERDQSVSKKQRHPSREGPNVSMTVCEMNTGSRASTRSLRQAQDRRQRLCSGAPSSDPRDVRAVDPSSGARPV